MPDRALGPFIVVRPLGLGGMGEVWLGRHEGSGTEVAIKVMTAANLRNELFQRAFAAEARAVASLDHPHIIRLYDVGTVERPVSGLGGSGPSGSGRAVDTDRLAVGSPYLVMELAAGGNLSTDPPPADWKAVREVLLTVLGALAHAHARGVIHRDIKPGNVLWGRPMEPGGPPRPILSDFGIAHAGDGGGRGGPTWGTPAYMAPERFTLEWRDLGPWTDLYSVGCLAFTLLRGRPPFKGEPVSEAMQAHLYRPVPSLRARCPVPSGLDGWLRGMLAKAPEDRYQGAADAAWALRALGEADVAIASPDMEPSSDTEPQPGSGSLSRPPPRSRTPPPGAESVQRSVGTAETTWTDGTFEPAAFSGEQPGPRRSAQVRRRPRLAIPPHPASWAEASPPGLPADLPGGGLRLFGLRVVPMVDRDEERDLLWQALGAVRQRGRAKGLLLRGRVGAGKTRLAEWLSEQAVQAGAAVALRADHGPGVGVPGLARMVASTLRVAGLGRRALRSRVLTWLQVQGVHDDWLARELVAVAGLGAGLQLEREDEPRDLRTAVRRFVELVARDRPLILHLDDVAWAPGSLSFASELLDPARRLPVLLVLTSREEALQAQPAAAAALQALVEDGLLTEIDVRPLPEVHRIELVRNLLGVEPDLARRVAERTAGNPLFTVTLVRDWVARDLLIEGPTGLTATGGAPLPMPEDLYDVWAQRLAALLAGRGPAARAALELAAAQGESVDLSEWREACAVAGVELPADLLDALLAEHLAARSAGSWRFVHDVVRESLLATAAEQGRLVDAHLACARVLQTRHADPGPLTRERLGRHLAAAGQLTQALPALLAGAAARLEQGDAGAALLVLGEAERTITRLPREEAPPHRVAAHLLRARALLEQGQPEAARTHARHAEASSQDPADPQARQVRASALLVLASVSLLEGQVEEAARSAAEVRSLGGQEATAEIRGALAQLQGELARLRGELDAAEEALSEAAEAFGVLMREAEWAACVVGLAQVAVDRGDVDHAGGLLASALERCRAQRNRRGEADALRVGGSAALVQGDVALADQRFRKAQGIYQRLGSANVQACRLGRARVAIARGQLDEAARLLQAVRDEHARSRVTQVRLGGIALVLAARQGDWPAFDRELEELAGLLVRSGLRLAEVRDLAQEAVRAATAQGQGERVTRARRLLA